MSQNIDMSTKEALTEKVDPWVNGGKNVLELDCTVTNQPGSFINKETSF